MTQPKPSQPRDGEGISRHKEAKQHSWSPDVDETTQQENPSSHRSFPPGEVRRRQRPRQDGLQGRSGQPLQEQERLRGGPEQGLRRQGSPFPTSPPAVAWAALPRWTLDHPFTTCSTVCRARRGSARPCGNGAHGPRVFDWVRVEVRSRHRPDRGLVPHPLARGPRPPRLRPAKSARRRPGGSPGLHARPARTEIGRAGGCRRPALPPARTTRLPACTSVGTRLL